MNDLLLAATLLTSTAVGSAQDFVGHRAANEGSFLVGHPVERVFPLYGPVEEAKWAPGWEPHWIFPERSVAERSAPESGWVFTTGSEAPQERVWYVEMFDAKRREIVYLVQWSGHMIYRIHITAEPWMDEHSRKPGTRTKVTYDFVGLSPSGNRDVHLRTDHPEAYALEMENWRRQISKLLDGGKP